MTKIDQVLSNDELLEVFASKKGSGDYNALDVMQWAQEAVLAKLAEREHIAEVVSDFQLVYAGTKPICEIEGLRVGMKLYAHPTTCLKQDPAAWEITNKNTGRSHITETKNIAEGASSCEFMSVRPLYTRPIPNNQGLLDSSSHIVDSDKMVDVDHIPDAKKMVTPLAQRKIQSVIDSGEYREMKGATVLVNENGHAAIVNHGGAFYWVDNEALVREFNGAGVGTDSDHIADASKKVPEGWQLVPKEPTEEMIQEADESDEEYSKRSFGEGIHLCQSGCDHYKVMLAAAPKYTGEK